MLVKSEGFSPLTRVTWSPRRRPTTSESSAAVAVAAGEPGTTSPTSAGGKATPCTNAAMKKMKATKAFITTPAETTQTRCQIGLLL